jgi:hypothetical protein
MRVVMELNNARKLVSAFCYSEEGDDASERERKTKGCREDGIRVTLCFCRGDSVLKVISKNRYLLFKDDEQKEWKTALPRKD